MQNIFTREQIIAKISQENPWWDNNSVNEYYRKLNQREYYKLFYSFLDQNQGKVISLMGQARVGKTIILHQCIDELIKIKHIKPQNICYLSLKNHIYNSIDLEDLLKYFIAEGPNKSFSSDIYIFFDDIQYVKEWESQLKTLASIHKKIRFIVSTSIAPGLKPGSEQITEEKFETFILPPITFHEYISKIEQHEHLVISKKKNDEGNDNEEAFEELNKHFIGYINYGGFPEISISDESNISHEKQIKSICDRILLIDLPGLYGIDDIQELNALFSYFAMNSGSEMSINSIAFSSGISKNTIKKYINYLQRAFLIKIIQRIDHNAKQFERANFFKVYLTNPCMRTALFSSIKRDDPFMPNMVETALFSQYTNNYIYDDVLQYARWAGGEIDLVFLNHSHKPIAVLEIKWSKGQFEKPEELKNVNYFCGNHNISSATITTVDMEETLTQNDFHYKFIPASLYCYESLKNLMEMKLMGW
jgi:predicted AAA+ superfamily ATPase